MKLAVLLIALIAIVAAISTLEPVREPKRLIAFSDTDRRWLKPSTIDRLRWNNTFFVDITDYPDFSLDNPPQSVNFADFPSGPLNKEEVENLISKIDIKNVEAIVTHLSTAFPNRKYNTQSGRESALWIFEEMKRIAGGNSDIDVRLFEHSFGVQPSVIATIAGKGNLAGEHVIIGGHEDSTAFGNIAPGADDDGTGSATVMEVFRIFVENVATGSSNRRTLEFQTYAAEEVGLRGSGAIAADYKARMVNVYAMLQFDMTGYKAPNDAFMSPITDYTSPTLTQFMRDMIDAYCDAPRLDSTCGYGCSDHASFHNNGFPAVFTFEAPFRSSNPDIHTARDTVDKLTWSWAHEFVKLGVGAMYELAVFEG